ncbi:biotin carboxyl carrier protein [Lachnospiraceae bacterium PFB1-21]|uniref:biotin/lipoyl-containing protein n=1 Tax=Ohessyouella blattaphilus TaxID=2949333 RepID=UPI003E2C1DD4
MKNYTITVNGVAYDVTVEEKGAGAAPVAPVAVAPVAPAAPVTPAAPAAAPAAPTAAPANAGGIEVKAGAAGKVFKVEAAVGTAVKKGDPVIIIEAMKMEIPVVAPEDGTVASVNVGVGDAVEAGAVLATLN